MNDVQFPASILVFIAGGVALFQIALALGAPWGEWAFGGQHPGRLPRSFRISSATSLVVYGVQIAHFGAVATWWASPFNELVSTILNWVFVAFFAMGTVMNGISRSPKERFLWTPIVALSLACALIVAL